jgi:hypothetical protein
MEGGREGERREYQESVSVTQKIHQCPKEHANPRALPKTSLMWNSLKYYDKGNFPTAHTRGAFKKNIVYKDSFHILITYSYKTIQLYSSAVCYYISFITLPLLQRHMKDDKVNTPYLLRDVIATINCITPPDIMTR